MTARSSGVLALTLLLLACGGGSDADAERTSFQFMGTVEQVDTAAGRITVLNDDIPGWMSAMSMSYATDQPEALTRLEVGSRVRATVYEGDFATLYGVEVIRE
jgi:Cu/Ag efflux protein CusF